MQSRILVSLALLVLPTATVAEIYKLAVPTDNGLQLYWWPILPVPAGWVHDEDASRSSGVNMLIPLGKTFAGAPAVIYARADYKPRLPDIHSLAEYVANDRTELAKESATTVISKLPDVKTGDGRPLQVISYVIPSRHQWEVAAYGEEGDFFLLITLSASSEAGFNDARTVFYGMLAKYKERL